MLSLALCGTFACSQANHGGGGGADLAGGGAGGGGLDGGGLDGGGGGAPTALTITPNPATVTVTVQDGVVTTTPLGFTAADQDGNPVTASWQIDRGELGTLAAGSGLFTANGLNAGVAHVTATSGSVQASATLTVQVHAVNLGANAGSGTGPQSGGAPAGGYNGVGGTPLGGAPPGGVVTQLGAGSGTNAAFTFLYPYDGTVFPRGMLPPLLQWSLPAGYQASAIWMHLKEANFEFEGYYAGTALVNAPIDAAAWTAAVNSNAGDALLVELKVTDGTTVYGPIALHVTIAPSRLRGTVYYNTYDSKLNPGMTNGSDGNGSVLSIQPGGFAPALAVPALKGTCHACHEVSSDGSTLFTATSIGSDNAGAVFDLRQSPVAQTATYTNTATPKTGGLFTYGGIYPDGTMALASSKEDYHAWTGSSDLFAAATQPTLSPTGFASLVTQAVTPSFSPDGRRVAFAFWAGAGNASTHAGGASLAVMDFDCGAAMSSLTCAGASYGFSNLRSAYLDATASHYVGWPSFTPDGKMVVFQHTFTPSADGGSVLNTRAGAQSELWLADVPDPATGMTRFSAERLCAANGYSSADCTTKLLPTNANNHADDEQLNFEPNVTPIASGGYYWVVFTSRRLYGNVATTDPYFPTQGTDPATVTSPMTKKLWMAAIDPNPKPGQDPSHPAFYLPGQELMSGNMRAFWVNEPCHPSGTSCQTGDECCTGYCSDNGAGMLTCGDRPAGCVPEYGKCATDADCCGSGSYVCIAGLCSVAPIP